MNYPSLVPPYSGYVSQQWPSIQDYLKNNIGSVIDGSYPWMTSTNPSRAAHTRFVIFWDAPMDVACGHAPPPTQADLRPFSNGQSSYNGQGFTPIVYASSYSIPDPPNTAMDNWVTRPANYSPTTWADNTQCLAGPWRLVVKLHASSVWKSGKYALTLSIGQGDCATSGDAGASITDAPSLVLAGACIGAIDPGANPTDTADWFKVSVNSAQVGKLLRVELTPSDATDYDLCIANPAGTDLACAATAGSQKEFASVTLASSGSWFLKVLGQSGSGMYKLYGLISPPSDCTASDAHDVISEPKAGVLPTPTNGNACVGQLTDSDRYDFYTVNLPSPAPAGGRILVATVWPNLSADYGLCIHPPGSTSGTCSANPAKGLPHGVTLTTSQTGNWVVQVFGSTGTSNYKLWTRYYPAQADCGVAGDAAASQGSATQITIPIVAGCSGKLDYAAGDNWDWFKFSVSGTSQLRIKLSPPAAAGSANYDICLYHVLNGNAVMCHQDSAPGATDIIAYSSPPAGQYWLSVFRPGSDSTQTDGDYGLVMCQVATTGCLSATS